jgi:hypothetical protein
MSERKHPGRVEDFTDAFLVSFGFIVFIALLTIHALLGFLWALGCAYACDKAMSRWSRRSRQEIHR